MATLNFDYNTEKSEEYLSNWIETNLEKMIRRKVPSEDIKIDFDKSNRLVSFKGKTVSGRMTFKEGIVNVSIELPLLYRMFGATVKSSITDILKSI